MSNERATAGLRYFKSRAARCRARLLLYESRRRVKFLHVSLVSVWFTEAAVKIVCFFSVYCSPRLYHCWRFGCFFGGGVVNLVGGEGSENGGRGGRWRQGAEATTRATVPQRVQEGCGRGMRDGKEGW